MQWSSTFLKFSQIEEGATEQVSQVIMRMNLICIKYFCYSEQFYNFEHSRKNQTVKIICSYDNFVLRNLFCLRFQNCPLQAFYWITGERTVKIIWSYVNFVLVNFFCLPFQSCPLYAFYWITKRYAVPLQMLSDCLSFIIPMKHRRHDTQHNGTWHNDTQHNVFSFNTKLNDTA